MSERVYITDVGPRDGLQNEVGAISTADKAKLVRAIARTGVDEVEITSFVSPGWIPQLGDAEALCDLLASETADRPIFSALVPNEKGLDRLLGANARAMRAHKRRIIDKVNVFTAASESFSRKNTNATIDESLARLGPVIARALELSLPVRGYISCAIACPFEGPTDPAEVAKLGARLAEFGAGEIALGDTIGAGTRESTARVVERVLEALSRAGSSSAVALHMHDTFGLAGECVREGLKVGVRRFDGAAGGLGGCPYATRAKGERAPGNIATESLVRIVEAEGFETGVDHYLLGEAASVAQRTIAGARGGP